jgi:glucose-6-phosphate dehydrogenase assembly protein OpcA
MNHSSESDDGVEVPFASIEAALAEMAAGRAARQAPARALTATVVAVGPPARLRPAADALREVGGPGGVRGILISTGSNPAPPARVSQQLIAIDGLRPEFVNNAVAALRLSSLPTLVWWRAGSPEFLADLAHLADRVVLDVEHPDPVWARALDLLEVSAFTDLRWTRLTRWRALTAHFFDMPAIRAEASRFDHLHVTGCDGPGVRLYAGWLRSCLRWRDGVAIRLDVRPGGAPIECVEVGNGRLALVLRLVTSGTCLETFTRVEGRASASRIVSLGDQELPALLAEELRVRSRDFAFERALRAAGALE